MNPQFEGTLINKRGLKVLECPGYVSVMDDELPEIEPVVGRDGFYYDRQGYGTCWAELNGRAFLIEKSHFIMTLKELDHKPLRESERAAILALTGLHQDLKRPLLELLYWDDFCQEIRRIQFESKWQARKFFGETKLRFKQHLAK